MTPRRRRRRQMEIRMKSPTSGRRRTWPTTRPTGGAPWHRPGPLAADLRMLFQPGRRETSGPSAACRPGIRPGRRQIPASDHRTCRSGSCHGADEFPDLGIDVVVGPQGLSDDPAQSPMVLLTEPPECVGQRAGGQPRTLDSRVRSSEPATGSRRAQKRSNRVSGSRSRHRSRKACREFSRTRMAHCLRCS